MQNQRVPIARLAILAIAAAMITGCAASVPEAPTHLPEARITGTVRYADGRGVANCRVEVKNPAFANVKEVHCDAQGRYELSLEHGTYNAIAISDEGYGKTTLEFWAWNVRVTGDLILDATMDRLEVYNLSVWNSKGGSPAFFVSFRPMALDRALAMGSTPTPRVAEGDTLPVVDISPALTARTIEVTLDGAPMEIQSLQRYYEHHTDRTGGNAFYMPATLVQLRRPSLARGLHMVRVRIIDARTGAVGEGVTWFESNEAGLGF